MKTTRRIFIKQSTFATIAALGAGALAWTDLGCAQTQIATGDIQAKKFGDTVQMATNLTLDMNGSTFKLNPNALAKAMMFAMVECTDSHVINGTFEGDLKEHDFKKAPNNSEWVNALLIGQGSSYCSYKNVKVVDVTGYGTNTTMGGAGSKKLQHGYSAAYKEVGAFAAGDIDAQGNDLKTDMRLTSVSPMDISKFIETMGYLQLGKFLGYQGNPAGSWIYKASFYDANQKFLESIEGYMYRKMFIPEGAKFARFTLFSNTDPEKLKGLSVFNFLQPYNCSFIKVHHENVRCVGMCPSGFYNLLAEGCTFENCGSSSAKCAFDSEDGWDMMQDLTFRNNTFGKNPHNEFLPADGDNFVIENNTLSTYMYDRTRGSVYRNNKFRPGGYGTAGFNLGTRQRSGYPRIYNNIIEGDTKLIGATGSPNCEYRIVNNQCHGNIASSRGEGATVTAAYFYNCKIDGNGIAAKVVKCDIKNVQNNGGVFEIYDSTITDSLLKMSGINALSKIIRCTIKNCHGVNINSSLFMKGNTITDTDMTAGGGWQENIVCAYLDNTITTSFESFLSLGNSFKEVIFDNNTVISTHPNFAAIVMKNPQAKTAKTLTVVATKSTFAGAGGTVFNIIFPPAAGTLLTIYAKGNKYTGIEAINAKAFDMKTVKLLEEDPPA